MKKLLTVLVAALMVFALVGCSSKEETAAPAANGQESYKIAVSIYEYTDNFMTTYRNNMIKYFDELNAAAGYKKFDYVFADAASSMDTQSQDVDNWITQGYDCIMLNLVQTSSGDVLAKKCEDAGIPLVMFNREMLGFNYPADQCYIGADATQSGTFQGQIIYDLPDHGDLNGDGTLSYVMIWGDIENPDAQQRSEYSIKYIKEQGGIELKQLNPDRDSANWMRDQAQPKVADLLTKFGNEIEVVFCNNDDMAYGALAAIEAAGRTVGKDIYLVGVDAGAEACEDIMAGKMCGSVLNDGIGQSHASVDAAVAFCTGAENPYAGKSNMIPYVKVTSENVEEIYAANYGA